MFKAFKPSGMEKIARAMGYQGNMQGFQDYLAQDPMRQQQMQGYQQKAMQMAKGGVVKMQQGGTPAQTVGPGMGGNPSINQFPGAIRATTMAVGEEGGPMPDLGPGGIFGTPKTAAIGEDEPTPVNPSKLMQPTTMAVGEEDGSMRGEIAKIGGGELPNSGARQQILPKTMAVGEDEPSGIGGGISKQTLAIGEDQPTPLEINPNAYTRAVGEDGQVPPRLIAATQAVGEQPGDLPPITRPNVTTQAMGEEDGNFTGNLVAASGQLLPTTEAMGEDGNFFRVPDNRQPVTIDGITYNSYTRAMGETSQPPPPPQQPITQLPQQPSQKVPQQYVPQQEFENIKKTQFKDPYGQAYDSKEEYEAAMLTAETRKFKTEDGQTIDVPFVSGRPTIQIPEGATATGDDPVKMYNEVYEIPQAEVGEIELAPTVGDITAQMLSKPGLPPGATTMAAQIQEQPGQMIDPTTGQVTGTVDVTAATAGTALATPAQEKEANLMQASTAAAGVDTALQATQAAQGTVDPKAEITAAQQTASSVGNVSAAQGNAILMDNPNQREIQNGELIDGVANAEKASKFTEEIQAAQATPSKQATVQGQLEGLMTQFEGGETPVWAAGAMRAATAAMAARGLGASSIAGQAVVQAAMESALPIAQADAAVQSQFEAQNLSNRQQRAMLAAEQRAKFMGMEFDQAFQSRVLNAGRIADVANRNFTAEQQVALENSRIANSMNLANLNNSQALIMAEAAALSQLDMANLNNRQQAAVQNAQNFMQMDMANLSNRQQTEMFKSQQRIQSLFNDQAAENAARQFNASSQNQVDQFFANLSTQTSQFNASQTNAQNQFNAGQLNAIEQFNAEINNQRDQFNAKNQLVIAQNNAQWRREIATANTAAVNRANEINASAVLEMSRDAYDNLWNYYSDTMEWAWTSAESQLDRYQEMALEQLRQDKALERTNIEQGTSAGNAIGNMIATLGSAIIPKLF